MAGVPQSAVRITLAEAAAAMAAAPGGAAILAFSGVSIDSRSVRPGELFFAIRGERFDGHDYVAAALAAGAAGVVVERGRDAAQEAARGAGAAALAVADVRRALTDLARARRAALAPTVVGITGSNGKTTTKELTAAILEEAAGPDAVLRTGGNLNNDLGVPLTLLRLTPAHRYAVVEMGMSARGEIAALAALAAPQVGVVTNVAPAHLEHLGTLANIAHAKGELFAALGPTGRAVLPDDEPLLEAEADAAAVAAAARYRFGAGAGARARVVALAPAGEAGLDLTLALDGATVSCRLPLVGPHNARNAAAAAAAALALGLGPDLIARGLARGRTAAHRSAVALVGGRRVIDDCYNANPASTRAALETLTSLRRPGETAVALLGDMLELGPEGPRLHEEVGALAARLGVDHLVVVGALGRAIAAGARAAGLDPARVVEAADAGAAAAAAHGRTRPGDWVLVKGSRGMRLEAALEALGRLGGGER
ncbi:MAG TPA: UDP-N-acetylmuramoyl-tripeptide--D-alanyl-D-alanine ligase [Polyangia bacterium]|jgi:UDP-N-acetylmuramoyl-tripeptide--D-alanyl-D-alanine ligase